MKEDYELKKGTEIHCMIEEVGDIAHKLYDHRLLYRCFIPMYEKEGYKTVKADDISIFPNVAKVDIEGAFGKPYDITMKMTKNAVCSVITEPEEEKYPYTTIHTTLRCE